MQLQTSTTPRGFQLVRFKDSYDTDCSIQQSSSAIDECIWIGINEPNPQVLHGRAKELGIKTDANSGWVPFPIPDGVSINTRMHLTREQVKRLLPVLEKFVSTGEIL